MSQSEVRAMKITKTSILIASVVSCLLLTSSALWAADSYADGAITSAIERRMLADIGVKSRPIEVETSKGIVTLSGSVDSILIRDRAVAVARSIKGVRSVVNILEIKAIDRSDRQIRRDVRDALGDDPVTDSLQIGVEVDEGVVTLTGDVSSSAEKLLCEQVAKGVRGVREIENQIGVIRRAKRSDEKIKADIEATLRANILIDDGLIRVEVRDGNVKLKGVVGSPHERLRAEWDAWLSDAKSVDISELKVD